MSFDLIFWHQNSTPHPEEAARIYDQLTDGLTGVVAASPAIENFHRAVLSEFPDLSEDNMSDSPWASPLYATDECIIASISWSRSHDVSSTLLELASRYGLTAYDPQDQVVHANQGEGTSR